MGGRYHLEQGLEFVAEDSGTADAPVVYEAEAGQEAHLIGGRSVSGFAVVKDEAILSRLAPEARGKVVQADLKAQGITNLGQMKSRGFGRWNTDRIANRQRERDPRQSHRSGYHRRCRSG
jgi:hypothetical protein